MKTHQTTEIACAEPWLIFQEEGVKVEVLANEDCGDKRVRHYRSPKKPKSGLVVVWAYPLPLRMNWIEPKPGVEDVRNPNSQSLSHKVTSMSSRQHAVLCE